MVAHSPWGENPLGTFTCDRNDNDIMLAISSPHASQRHGTRRAARTSSQAHINSTITAHIHNNKRELMRTPVCVRACVCVSASVSLARVQSLNCLITVIIQQCNHPVSAYNIYYIKLRCACAYSARHTPHACLFVHIHTRAQNWFIHTATVPAFRVRLGGTWG